MLFEKKKKLSRGASSKRSKVARRKINFPSIASIFLFVVLGAAGTAFYMGLSVLLSKPIVRVAVTGEFRYVDRQLIVEQVQPFLTQGFVRLKLEDIRDELKQQPWIDDVVVSRVWPDEISINVVEQKPIARWAKVAYLNHRGELFKPKKMKIIDKLPLLYGPEGSSEQVMENFQRFGEALQQQGLTLHALNLDQSGNWIATLDNQLSIVLGSDQIMEKMRRFVKTYQAVLSGDIERVQRIDLRYRNGLAVAWKNTKS
ncbi:MAG: cell division protein FtsQ/DivIB [Spongiibacteraceae bacterium]|nr:cell division protein FtsQ/DivIB [Spongiibacteraceae bacterium]